MRRNIDKEKGGRMILSKEVEVTINASNFKYYTNIGFDICVGDKIKIKIEDLTYGSNFLIRAKCDYCENEINIKYKLYNKSIKTGGKFTCSRKCGAIKSKESNIEKYGVGNISQISEIQEKKKITSLEKYGVEYSFQSDEIKDKIKLTNIDRYGFDSAVKSDVVKNKTKETNLKKYGTEYALQSDIIRNKSKETSLEKYGFEYPSQSPEVQNKIKESNIRNNGVEYPQQSDEIKKITKANNIERWGVDNPMKFGIFKEKSKVTSLEKYGTEYPIQNIKVLEKRIKNNIEKWGVSNNSQSDIMRSDYKISQCDGYVKYVGNSISLFNCIKCGNNFEINTDNFFSRKKQNIDLCTICNPIGDSSSIKESDLSDFISSIYSGEIIRRYRDGLEIDIYLPDIKVGFEFNGLYWHSAEYKDKNYHIDKTNHFKELGIKVIHIWEDDWNFKKDIIKSQVKNWVGKSENKIFARNCQVREVLDIKEYKNFLNDNHIQGYVNSKKRIGLYFNSKLVSLMTFDNFEGREKMEISEWNLSRFCNRLNTNVVGGASKLLNFFIKNIHPTRIISYANIDWSDGGLYNKLGFKLISISNPDYKYIIGGKRMNKSGYRKSKLKTTLTESSFMQTNGFNRIYDCGKMKFEITKKSDF